MIVNFSDRDAEAFHLTDARPRTGWQGAAKVAARKLDMLDAATKLDDLKMPPGNKLEALEGVQSGQHSMRINNQWRICFVWTEMGPGNVEITDYRRG